MCIRDRFSGGAGEASARSETKRARGQGVSGGASPPLRAAARGDVYKRQVYGYLKGEDGRFIVDEEAAPVVTQIFSLCLAGNGPTKIARVLTEQQIPTPGTLEYLSLIHIFKSFSIAEKFVMRTEISCSIRALAMHPAK